MEEKILFKNKFEATEEIYKESINELLKKQIKNNNKRMIAPIIVLAALIVLSIFMNMFRIELLIFTVIFIFIILFNIFSPKILPKIALNKTILHLGDKPWNCEVIFYDSNFETIRNDNKRIIEYENIDEVIETEQLIIIFLKGNMYIPIKKDAFETGNLSECMKFLTSKINMNKK